MEWYTPHTGKPMDLDDPKTYSGKHWKKLKTTMDMYYYAWSEIGKSLVYMDFMQKTKREDLFAKQRIRVHQFAFLFAYEHRDHWENTEKNRMWWRKFIFKFADEVENQC